MKQELDLNLELSNVKNLETMSAPPSPMLPGKLGVTNLLQKLLNSNDKVAYAPDYAAQMRPPHSADVSTEVSHFFDGDVQQSYR